MFKAARLKLTAWYLAIIMLVSVAFSVVIYQVLVSEIIRFSRMQRIQIEQNYAQQIFLFDPDILYETQRRVVLSLVILNMGILALAGVVGYWLAGRTLEPIQEMVDEQHRFVSDASHELKTPITALKSGFEVYLRDPHPKLLDAKTLIAESLDDVNRLQTLAGSLLTLSSRTRRDELPVVKLDPKEMVATAVARTKKLAASRKILVKAKGSGKEVSTRADKDKLTEALVILIDNAIKYNQVKGTVNVSWAANETKLEFSVTDNGIGIAKKDLTHIFDRFYRADEARTHTKNGGYGLGLAIAQSTAKQHGGTLIAKSEPGKGSAFILTIPSVPFQK